MKFRIGWIHATLRATDIPKVESLYPLLFEELRSRGYVSGENLELDNVSPEGDLEKLPEVAAALVRRKPDVIIAAGSQLTIAAKNATSTIPIVMLNTVQPVKYGLIASLAHPGGNVTGLGGDVSPEIEAKRLAHLQQAIPGLARVSCMATKSAWEGPLGQELRRSAGLVGLKLEHAEFTPKDLGASLQRIQSQRPEALVVVVAREIYPVHKEIAEFTLSSRLPATVPFAEMAEAGALMSYGVDLPRMWQAAAIYIDKIFKGANPAELPVEQPSSFELVINLKTAKALGLKLPATFVAQASRVIE